MATEGDLAGGTIACVFLGLVLRGAADDAAPATLRVRAAPRYVVDFLSAASVPLQAALAARGVSLVADEDGTVALRWVKGGAVLTAAEAQTVQDGIGCNEDEASVRACLASTDWAGLAQVLVSESMEVIREGLAAAGAPLPESPPAKVLYSVSYGDPQMVPFDVAFQTLAWEYTVCVPNVAELSAAHYEFMATRYRTRRHLHHHWLLRVVGAMCHETLHVVQGITKQVDRTKDNWSSEHDASVPNFTLLREVLRRLAAKGDGAGVLAAPGLFEAAAAYFCEELGANRAARWREDDEAQYLALRSSFGLAPIDVETSSERVTVQSDFKGLLSIDCDTGPCPRRLAEVLLLLFAPARRNCAVAEAPRPSWEREGELFLGVPDGALYRGTPTEDAVDRCLAALHV